MNTVLERSSGQITLCSDGWTNLRGEALINYVAITRLHSIFLKSVPTGHDRHTGQYIADGLSDVVRKVGGEKILAITTDNASNMVSSWALLKQQFPHLLMLGCSSHIINLLISDIFTISSIGDLFNIILGVVRYFKSSYINIGLLNSKAKALGITRPALQMPGATRWQGKLYAAESLLKNRSTLEALIREPDALLPATPTRDQREKL